MAAFATYTITSADLSSIVFLAQRVAKAEAAYDSISHDRTMCDVAYALKAKYDEAQADFAKELDNLGIDQMEMIADIGMQVQFLEYDLRESIDPIKDEVLDYGY